MFFDKLVLMLNIFYIIHLYVLSYFFYVCNCTVTSNTFINLYKYGPPKQWNFKDSQLKYQYY